MNLTVTISMADYQRICTVLNNKLYELSQDIGNLRELECERGAQTLHKIADSYHDTLKTMNHWYDVAKLAQKADSERSHNPSNTVWARYAQKWAETIVTPS